MCFDVYRPPFTEQILWSCWRRNGSSNHCWSAPIRHESTTGLHCFSTNLSFVFAEKIGIIASIVGRSVLCWSDTMPSELRVVNALQIGLFWVWRPNKEHRELQSTEWIDMQISKQRSLCCWVEYWTYKQISEMDKGI